MFFLDFVEILGKLSDNKKKFTEIMNISLPEYLRGDYQDCQKVRLIIKIYRWWEIVQ